MELTKTQYKQLEELMQIAGKLAKISNYQLMCTMLYIVEDGCKWKVLPKTYGKWHIVYVKFNRWSQNGTIAKAIVYLFSFFKTFF